MPTGIPVLDLPPDAPNGALPTGVSDGTVFVPGNDGLIIVVVTNPTGSDIQINLVPTLMVGGVLAATVAITVPANTTQYVRPLPPAVYNDDQGNAYIVDGSGGDLQFAAVGF